MSHCPGAGAAPQTLLNKGLLSPSTMPPPRPHPQARPGCAHHQTHKPPDMPMAAAGRHRSGLCSRHLDMLPSPPGPSCRVWALGDPEMLKSSTLGPAQVPGAGAPAAG